MAQTLIALVNRTDLTEEEKTQTRYVVAHNGSDVYHAIELEPEMQLATGQPNLEVFNTKEDAYAEFGDSIQFASDIVEEEEEI